jgi:ABC-type phosphate/phosphonate transport system permease subunit
MMSSAFMGGIVKKAGLEAEFAEFNPGFCAGRLAELGESGPALCSAYAEGLRMSMVATVMFLILAAVFYFLAARTYQKDRWSPAT